MFKGIIERQVNIVAQMAANCPDAELFTRFRFRYVKNRSWYDYGKASNGSVVFITCNLCWHVYSGVSS